MENSQNKKRHIKGSEEKSNKGPMYLCDKRKEAYEKLTILSEGVLGDDERDTLENVVEDIMCELKYDEGLQIKSIEHWWIGYQRERRGFDHTIIMPYFKRGYER